MPTLTPLPQQPVSLISEQVKQDTLSIMWDSPWHPIRDSQSLLRYWRGDLAREALFWHLQQTLEKATRRACTWALTAACSTSAGSAPSIWIRRTTT